MHCHRNLNALTATYGFDTLQRVTTISANGTQIAAYGYDAYGRRSTITRANGTGAGTTYGYDGADRINSLVQSLTGGAGVTYTLGYDPSGGLITRQVSNSAYTWHPPLASVSYTANGLNQYPTISPGGTSTYLGGNMTYDAASGSTFTYLPENQLKSVNNNTLKLAYDPTGRIQTKTASGVADTFLYAGSMLVGEYDSSGNILSRYIPGPGQDEAALWYSGAGTTTPQWLHADNQGSTIAWSNASGASLGTLAYDPYGQPSAWSGPRYAFTGQLMLPEGQIYDYKARAYSPGLGRFLQTDPIGMASDVNLYAYVGNDPVNGWDPSGMATQQQQQPATTVCIEGVCTTTVSEFVVTAPARGAAQVGPVQVTGPVAGVVGGPNGDGRGGSKQGRQQTPLGPNSRCLMNAPSIGIGSGVLTTTFIITPMHASESFEITQFILAGSVGAGEGGAATFETGPGVFVGIVAGFVVGGIVYYAAHKDNC